MQHKRHRAPHGSDQHDIIVILCQSVRTYGKWYEYSVDLIHF